MGRGPRARRDQRGSTSLGTGSQEDGGVVLGIHPSIYPSIHPFIYPPIHSPTYSIHLTIHLPTHPPTHTYIYSSIQPHPPTQESVCPPVQFSIYPIWIVSIHPIWESVSPTIDNLVYFLSISVCNHPFIIAPCPTIHRYSSPVLYKSLPLCVIQLLLSHQPGITSGPPSLHALVSLPCLLLFYCGWHLSQASCAAVF